MRPILDVFPIANAADTANGLAEFAASYANPADHDVFATRLDWNINEKLTASGAYNFANSGAAVRASDGLSANTLRQFDMQSGRFTGKATYTPLSTMVVNGSINFSRNRVRQTFTLDGFGGANIHPSIMQSPFSMMRAQLPGQNAAFAIGDPVETVINQILPAAHVNWIHENHEFKFGGEFLRLSYNVGAQSLERNISFSNSDYSGTAERINEIHRGMAPSVAADEISAFVTDEWRVTPRLKLNLSLRWEADVAPNSGSEHTFGSGSTQMPNSLGNFAPRVAVAYDVFNNSHSVIRAGGVLYFDHGLSVMSESFANSYPTASGRYARSETYTTENLHLFTPTIVFANGLSTPRSWHVYGEFQQMLPSNIVVTGAYRATFGRSLYRTRTAVDEAAIPQYVREIDNSGSSNRHEASLNFQRRLSGGLAIYGRYTYAKSTDNVVSDSFGKSFLPGRDAGPSDFDVRHDLSFWGTYSVPTFFNSGWAKSLSKGWTVSGFVNARSGFPINVTYARLSDFFNELVRPDVVPNVPLFVKVDGIRALNPDAFRIPDTERQGSLGRNALRGFPFFQVNASLAKRFSFANERNLELKIEAINLLNSTNFADPSGNLGSQFGDAGFAPSRYFGQSVGTYGGQTFTPFYLYGGPRSLQMSAKFSF
jgi:hypothetical protein